MTERAGPQPLPTEMTDQELGAALLVIVSDIAENPPTAAERYGLIYEAAVRLRAR